MCSLLAQFDYDGEDHRIVGDPDPLIVGPPASLHEYDEEDLSPAPIAADDSSGRQPAK